MKPGKTTREFLLIILAGWAGLSITFTTESFAAGTISPINAIKSDTPQNTVTVGVSAQHAGGKIVYHYRVTNYTQQDISAISIGLEHKSNNGIESDVYELLELPSGWNEKFGIPSASSNTPTGWRANLIAPDATVSNTTLPGKTPTDKAVPDKPSPENQAETHAITWEVMNDKSPTLLPGQSMSKLSITLDKADPNYLTGHATITFSEGGQAPLTVLLDRLDNTPPFLTVTMSPDKISVSNTKPVAVKAIFTTNDDDRLPEIKLESITANDPLEAGDVLDATFGRDDRYLKFRAVSKIPEGRVYTITYSATDASGNQALATATVTVIPATETTPVAASVPPVAQPQTLNPQTSVPTDTPPLR